MTHRIRRSLQQAVLGLFAVILLAGEAPAPAPTAESWDKLKAAHVEALVAFSTTGGDNKAGSLELELREQAIAVARRIDSKSPKLKNLFARKRAMTAEEQTADRTLRDLVAARDKERLAQEAASNNKGPDVPPAADDPAAVLEILRHRQLNEQVAFAKRMSLDPDDMPTVVLRKTILTQAKVTLGAPKWAWERRLKDRIDQLLLAKYEPWVGTWVCSAEWGELTLRQDGTTVKGTWKEGSLSGEVKGRHVVGTWTGQGTQHGGFSFTLGDNDLGFSARVTDKVDRPTSFDATLKSSIEPTTVEVIEEKPDEPKKPEPAPGQ